MKSLASVCIDSTSTVVGQSVYSMQCPPLSSQILDKEMMRFSGQFPQLATLALVLRVSFSALTLLTWRQ